jgi:arylsulfatase A-like enzyme
MSFYPIINGSEADWRKDFLYEYYEYPGPHSVRKCRGIRTEKWKYIHFFEEPQEFELYNLVDDPHEMNNLIHDPSNKPVIDGLRGRMRQLRDQLGDPDL